MVMMPGHWTTHHFHIFIFDIQIVSGMVMDPEIAIDGYLFFPYGHF
jgi:hypothetical protein